MCIICVEYQSQKLTLFEARRNFREMIVTLDPNHAKEVSEMLTKAEKAAKAAKKP